MTAADAWPPAADTLWLVHGTMGAVMHAHEDTGERVAMVAVRIASTLNTVGTEDDRTLVLGLDEVAGLISGLMSTGTAAFGNGAMMTAMADTLNVSASLRDRTTEAVERALDEVRGDE